MFLLPGFLSCCRFRCININNIITHKYHEIFYFHFFLSFGKCGINTKFHTKSNKMRNFYGNIFLFDTKILCVQKINEQKKAGLSAILKIVCEFFASFVSLSSRTTWDIILLVRMWKVVFVPYELLPYTLRVNYSLKRLTFIKNYGFFHDTFFSDDTKDLSI